LPQYDKFRRAVGVMLAALSVAHSRSGASKNLPHRPYKTFRLFIKRPQIGPPIAVRGYFVGLWRPFRYNTVNTPGKGVVSHRMEVEQDYLRI